MLTLLKRYPLSLLLIAIVTYLSFFTPPKTQLSEVTNFDKFVHFSMYFFLSSLLWLEHFRAHRKEKAPLWHGLVGALLCPIVYSGVVELLQAYATTNRSGEWWDFAANSLGAVAAFFFCFFFVRKKFL